MKTAFRTAILIFFFASPLVRAADDAPPIPIEVSDECTGDASTLAYLVRDKFRDSKAFRLTESAERLHLHLEAKSESGMIVASLVWTYQPTDSKLEYYASQSLITVGFKNMKDQMPDVVLADAENVWRALKGKK